MNNHFFQNTLKYLGFSVVFVFSACSSKFIVKSDPPQAEVYVVDSQTGEKKTIGKTPLEIPADDIKKIVQNQPTSGEFYSILVEKNGFETQNFNIPTAQFTTLITSLDVKLKPGATQKELSLAKEILDHMFLAQKFALTNQFERAQIEIDKILTPFPNFTRALSMRASIYYAQKKYAESLKWFEEALKNDPTMEEAVKMTAKLRPLVVGGVSVPDKKRTVSSEKSIGEKK